MIPDLLLALGATIISLLAYAFGLLNWNFPSEIPTAIQTFFTVLHTFSSFIPWVGDIVAIALVLVPAYVIRYGIDIVRWIWAHVPWIGTQASLPGGSISNQPKQPYYQALRKSDNFNDPQRQTFSLYKRKKGKRQS